MDDALPSRARLGSGRPPESSCAQPAGGPQASSGASAPGAGEGSLDAERVVEALLAALSERSEPRWVSTIEAASILGVHRSRLDAVAPRAVLAYPRGVIKAGSGSRNCSYRWRVDLLGETLASADDIGQPSRDHRKKRSTVAGRRSRSLLDLVRDE